MSSWWWLESWDHFFVSASGESPLLRLGKGGSMGMQKRRNLNKIGRTPQKAIFRYSTTFFCCTVLKLINTSQSVVSKKFDSTRKQVRRRAFLHDPGYSYSCTMKSHTHTQDPFVQIEFVRTGFTPVLRLRVCTVHVASYSTVIKWWHAWNIHQ